MTDSEWDALLAIAPTRLFSGKLLRAVAQMSFDMSRQYLFTSAKRNRCNPAGVDCIYLAEDRDTAQSEYDKYFTDVGDHQPCLTFTGHLKAAAIIDLGDAATCTYLGLDEANFYGAFRTRTDETRLEALGRAVARQKSICAIRFPSEAMNAESKTGLNFAVFKAALAAPDSLIILGPAGASLDKWP